MKINRFIALAAIALLVVGAMGAIGMKAYAQTTTQTDACAQQDDDSAEIQDAQDTDNMELQCGDQNESGEESEVDDSVEGQDAEPTGTPVITAEVAQKTAESYLNAGSAVKTELDNENGALVYSVEFSNGTDVKVDAMTGNVLGTESAED